MPLQVRNWSSFQHYKTRRPPWVKLHRTLLDNYEYINLPDASQALAPRLWLLASESEDGSIPSDPAKLAFRLHRSADAIIPAVNALIQAGFLEGALDASATLAPRKQNHLPETETEAEERERQNTAVRSPDPIPAVPSNGNGRGLKREDRETYGRAVWGEFSKRFGISRECSSAEWHLISKWMDANLPLAVVLRGIGETGGKPRNLYASEAAVARAVEYWNQAAGVTA